MHSFSPLKIATVIVASVSLVVAQSPVETGGSATFFFQEGFAGACGQVHSDFDLIAAIDITRYGSLSSVSPLCGQLVNITNTDNQKSVVITIADGCITCANENSFDLSVGAFEVISDLGQGEVPISWQFV